MPALGPLAALDEALLRMVIDLRWAPLTGLMTLLSRLSRSALPLRRRRRVALGLAIASIVAALARRVVRRRREDGAVIEAGAGAG